MFQQRMRTPARGRLLHDVETLLADTALVFSLLTGGCVEQREPDDDEDYTEDDDGVEEDRIAGGPDRLPPPGPIPGSSDGACCSEHWGGGCRDHSVESCVCGLDPACCTESWDVTCVMTARGLCNSCEPLDPG